MKKLLALAALATLTFNVARAQPVETDLVQRVTFRLTAISQGAGKTRPSGVVVSNATTSVINTRDVIGWLGTATGITFSNASLLVIRPLADGSVSRVVVRQTVNGSSVDADVTAFFARVSGDVSVNQATYAPDGSVNGTFYGIQGFTLQDTPIYTLPAHFTVSGFGITTVTTLVNRKGNKVGIADEGSVDNAAGTGDNNGSPVILEGHIDVTGQTVEVAGAPNV